ncbi:hypothetical protein [Pedobacter zeae]|uniref:Uncharacterized protein n=1 Tax=Pedobacter zeae TaxID=1737356 RepID=A0A7W6K9H7_9SPHI|nr:hypothetical protein [Pedobacter zeae]MBB4107696.1 hypothetical protein [Pedobacter zeae]GGG97651.1 hypothetical protein GCM10007422_09560 [Pedobacter zeae]
MSKVQNYYQKEANKNADFENFLKDELLEKELKDQYEADQQAYYSEQQRQEAEQAKAEYESFNWNLN